jgi:hypothetical protein
VCRPKETAATTQLLHADGGAIAGDDPDKLQRLMDDCTERFLSVGLVGLKMKDKKTKVMVMVVVDGAKAPTMSSKEAFHWQQGAGDCRTCQEKELSKAQCKLCVATCQKEGQPRHQSQEACSSGGREEWTKNPDNRTDELASEEELALPQERCISILAGTAKIECPVLNCSGRHGDQSKLRVHFHPRAASGGHNCNRAEKTTSQMCKLRHVRKKG